MNTNKLVTDNVASHAQPLRTGVPLEVLQQFCDRRVTGRLMLFWNSVCWTVRLESGAITYVSNSVDPFDRLTCYLRLLSNQVPNLTKEFRSQISLMFEDATDPADDAISCIDQTDPNKTLYRSNDYTALCWLATERHVSPKQIEQLIGGMSKEAIEPLFWLDEVNYTFSDRLGNPLTLCKLSLSEISYYCQQRLRLWQLLAPQIWSPYQRPYFFGQTVTQKELLPELQLHQKFSTILKGFNFRHLAILMKNDELKIAGSLMPYICEEVVVLRDPQPPFDRLPKVPVQLPRSFQKLKTKDPQSTTPRLEAKEERNDNVAFTDSVSTATSYTIACIDDSPTILNEINRFLNDSNLTVIAISDPIKALMQIINSKPDLILLDVTMPKVNGYELCRLIRNKATFKNTPIIMVTGNTGLIDRAKAKISGATDYLTKPFTQEGLLKMIFRHLT